MVSRHRGRIPLAPENGLRACLKKLGLVLGKGFDFLYSRQNAVSGEKIRGPGFIPWMEDATRFG